MPLILFALAWLPFSVAFLTFELFGVTFSLYVLAILLACPVAMWRLASNGAGDPAPYSTLVLAVLNVQAIFFLIAGPEPWSAGFIAFDTVTPNYKYVHGLLVPSASYFALKLLIRSDRDFRRAVVSLVIGCAVFALIYIVTSAGAASLARVKVLNRDAVTAACFFSIAFVFAAFTPVLTPWKRLSMAGVNGVALALTLSRGFIVATLLSPLLVRWARPRTMLFGFLAFVLLSLVVTFLGVANRDVFQPREWDPKLENSLERLVNPEYWKSGIYGRLQTFVPSVQRFENSPAIGTGFAGTQAGATVHNFHLEWLEISGILGYLLYGYLFVSYFYRLAKRRIHDPWSAATGVCIVLIFLNGLLNGVLHGVMPYVLFILLGLGDAHIGLSRQGASPAVMRYAVRYRSYA